jgi:murein DD-endopeptidase MepM/ murein hydrolase activator NlpD
MLTEILKKYQNSFEPVVRFNAGSDKLLLLDFTEANTTLTATIVENTALFSAYMEKERSTAAALYGIGGYDEHRTVYSRSPVFDAPAGEEPRRLHLGVDIWGAAGTEIFAPIDGIVHSFAFNDQYGDYGATIILQHQLEGFQFHTLYGHLSLQDLAGLTEGKPIRAGELIAHFGEPEENGHWPPHLHFQLVIDLEGKKGDYPGVCQFSKRAQYLANCPDPDLILGMMAHAGK